jgi:short subunit dehydrogenase-like uncharacterized protein
MNENSKWMIYGANGYTGDLLVRYAVERGYRPVLAGRSPEKLAPIAEKHGLEVRAFDLTDKEKMDAALEDMTVVAHCAGPFQRTCGPMLKACIRTKTHYTDITGEIDVFELCAASDKRAKAGGVMVMPGVGFDIVPSDCLAAHMKRRMPEATHLVLAFMSNGRPSHGTATTIVENIHRGGIVRESGKLVRKPAAWKTRTFDFGEGKRLKAITIPWGDVSTAYRSTQIPNIMVFMAAPIGLRLFNHVSRHIPKLLASKRVQAWLQNKIDSAPAGPTDEQRARQYARLIGEATDGEGNTLTSRLKTPDGYTLTVLTALAVLEKIFDGHAPDGFQTPSMAYGPDFILEVPGCEREDA